MLNSLKVLIPGKRNHFLLLPGLVLLFSSLCTPVFAAPTISQQGAKRDTLPAIALYSLSWNSVNHLFPEEGVLIAAMINGDSLVIKRADYDKYAFDSRAMGDPTDLFTKAEIPAAYPGGSQGWADYLQQKKHHFDEVAGTGTITVQFIVRQDGTVSDVEAIGGANNFELRNKAVKLIRESGRWHPAIQNFRLVRAVHKQSVSFPPAKPK